MTANRLIGKGFGNIENKSRTYSATSRAETEEIADVARPPHRLERCVFIAAASWPAGAPPFCGAPVFPGSPYCAPHRELCRAPEFGRDEAARGYQPEDAEPLPAELRHPELGAIPEPLEEDDALAESGALLPSAPRAEES